MRKTLLDRHGPLDTRGDSHWSRKAPHEWINLAGLRDVTHPGTLGRTVRARTGFL